METHSINIKTLIAACEQELIDLEYGSTRHGAILRHWEEFALWMEHCDLEIFTPEIGSRYCYETIGSDILLGVEKRNHLKLRAIRMLISYYRDGFFEFRTPSVAPITFQGDTGKLMESFLDTAQNVYQFSASSMADKRKRLHEFSVYLEKSRISLGDVNTQVLADFFADQNYSLNKTRCFSATVKQLFRYAYDKGAILNDLSFVVMPVKKNPVKLPSTYTEDEIRRILSEVERGSSIGKRDYLVLLLAAEYGWRASDITGFLFSWIDWDKNIILFNQHKTGTPVQYPLLSSVGNAIIDYLKNGRPDTASPEIIVGHDTIKRGKKLTSPTIHSIVTKYIKAANIDNWKQKKHGPHALRFSLATNLLKHNTSIPIIATVLGHQSTESTKRYVSLDINQLRKCALPIPPLSTDVFEVAI